MLEFGSLFPMRRRLRPGSEVQLHRRRLTLSDGHDVFYTDSMPSANSQVCLQFMGFGAAITAWPGYWSPSVVSMVFGSSQ